MSEATLYRRDMAWKDVQLYGRQVEKVGNLFSSRIVGDLSGVIALPVLDYACPNLRDPPQVLPTLKSLGQATEICQPH